MRKVLGVLFAGLFLVALARPVLADDNGSGPSFTFGASTSYVYDFNDPKVQASNSLAYANQEGRDESFNIDLVQLGISGARGKASYGAKLDYGDLALSAGDSSDGDIALQTAYLSYDFGGAGITAGRFDTPIGYEVLEPWGNANISRSYTWTLLQPINHDGVFVSGNAGIVDGMLGIANGFTVNEASTGFNDIDDEKAIIGAVGVAISDALNLYGSGIYTESGDIVDTQMYNAIISGKIPMQGSGIRYALEGNVRLDANDEGNDVGTTPEGDGTQWSLVAYAGADFGPTSLDLRGEYLDQDQEFAAAIPAPGADGRLWAITATAGWYLTDGLQFRIEYQHADSDSGTVVPPGITGVPAGSTSGVQFADGNNAEDSVDVLQAQLVWYPEL